MATVVNKRVIKRLYWAQQRPQHTPDARVRLAGWRLFLDVLVRTPDLVQMMIEGLRHEVEEAVKLNDPAGDYLPAWYLELAGHQGSKLSA